MPSPAPSPGRSRPESLPSPSAHPKEKSRSPSRSRSRSRSRSVHRRSITPRSDSPASRRSDRNRSVHNDGDRDRRNGLGGDRDAASRSPSRSHSRGRSATRSPSGGRSAERTGGPRHRSHSRSVSRSPPRRSSKVRREKNSLFARSSGFDVFYALSAHWACIRLLDANVSPQIVVEKLTKNVNESHLREIFGAYGDIESIDLPMNRQCKHSLTLHPCAVGLAVNLTHCSHDQSGNSLHLILRLRPRGGSDIPHAWSTAWRCST